MKNRTIACIGDSQVRALCGGLANILLSHTVAEASDETFGQAVPERPETNHWTRTYPFNAFFKTSSTPT